MSRHPADPCLCRHKTLFPGSACGLVCLLQGHSPWAPPPSRANSPWSSVTSAKTLRGRSHLRFWVDMNFRETLFNPLQAQRPVNKDTFKPCSRRGGRAVCEGWESHAEARQAARGTAPARPILEGPVPGDMAGPSPGPCSLPHSARPGSASPSPAALAQSGPREMPAGRDCPRPAAAALR